MLVIGDGDGDVGDIDGAVGVLYGDSNVAGVSVLCMSVVSIMLSVRMSDGGCVVLMVMLL